MTPVETAVRDGLLGAWTLVSWESIAEDGSVAHPMGADPEGMLVYTPDGTMMTTLARRDRAPISGGDMLAGPDAERLAAFGSFIAYASRFHIEGGDIIHEVVMSLFPNWVGSAQRRHVELAAGGVTLVLTSDPFLLRGTLSSQRLAFARVTDA